MSSITGYNPATVSTLASGTYRHVALSISGTVHSLYLDGSMVAQNLDGGNVFASYTSAISNLYIGCAGDLSYGLTGSIDDFKVWNRALPATDISAIYYSNHVIATFTPNLLTTAVIYFPLQSGTITNLGTLSSLTIQNGTNNTYATVGGKTGLRGVYTNSTFLVSGFTIAPSYSISVWFYCISWSSAFFGTCYNAAIDSGNLITFSADGGGSIYYRDGFFNYVVPTPKVGQWNHFVITIDAINKVGKFYINNTLQSTTIDLSSYNPINSMRTIEYPHYPFGTADSNTYARQFCVFNSVLTASNVSELYTTTA